MLLWTDLSWSATPPIITSHVSDCSTCKSTGQSYSPLNLVYPLPDISYLQSNATLVRLSALTKIYEISPTCSSDESLRVSSLQLSRWDTKGNAQFWAKVWAEPGLFIHVLELEISVFSSSQRVFFSSNMFSCMSRKQKLKRKLFQEEKNHLELLQFLGALSEGPKESLIFQKAGAHYISHLILVSPDLFV